MKGRVTLVSAGPGDAELLTVKAVKAIEDADTVVFDRLIGESVLRLIPKTAYKIDVGKNAGHHKVEQEIINEILIEEAQKGKNVVRLKGGDAFLFGRGGEEIEMLVEQGIDFSMIPGVTSSLAVPAYAGIPVTHRDYSSSVHIVTGRKKKDKPLDLDFESLVKLNGTIIFMMSISNIDEVVSKLLSAGMKPSMPCAVIENGTLPMQRKIISSLDKIAYESKIQKIVSPSILAVGEVCLLSTKCDFFSTLPLKGKKILVTRPENEPCKLKNVLERLGAEITMMPAIEITYTGFDAVDLKRYTRLLFTSANGVRGFWNGMMKKGMDSRQLHGLKIGVIGTGTAEELLKIGIRPDFTAENYDGESMIREMISKSFINSSDFVLTARGNMASKDLNKIMEKENILYHELTVYKTRIIKMETAGSEYDLVTFTSASCVRSFIESVRNSVDFSKIKVLCIGKKTADTARNAGMNPVISKVATIDSMVEAIEEIFGDEK